VPRDIERGMAAGFFNYITKPIKVQAFMQALDQALAFAHTGHEPAPTQEPL
jgi:CheY-like chemotaxis protein